MLPLSHIIAVIALAFTASLALSHFFIDDEYLGNICFYIRDCV